LTSEDDGSVDDRQEGVVALSRWRAVLARSRNPRKRLDMLLGDPQATALVPRIPVEDLYYLVRGVGLPDAGDALRLASPEQLQGCLDLDLWERDRVSSSRLLGWLEALAELPHGVLARTVRALDAELVSLILVRHTRIYDRTVGESPQSESPFITYRTPDGSFTVELRASTATGARTLERFVSRLYDADPDLARSFLTEAKWATSAELEEESYRWRTARLADLGFPSYEDALAIYRPAGPVSVQVAPPPDVADGRMLPAPFAESLGEDSFLGRTLARIDDPDRLTELSGSLVALLNQVLVADRVDPADLEKVGEVAARARDTVSLGLEHASGGDAARASALLGETSVHELFRIGYGLTHELGRRAQALERAAVIDPSLDSLLEPRPLYPCELDQPPTGGARPFRTVADVLAAGAFLEHLEHEVRTE
jgi:hypothetical protein